MKLEAVSRLGIFHADELKKKEKKKKQNIFRENRPEKLLTILDYRKKNRENYSDWLVTLSLSPYSFIFT